jgi:hypothetical protein
MPHEIELPDGSIAEFPDSMSDAQISDVLSKQFPAEQKQAPQESKGFSGIGKDIANDLRSVLPEVGHILKNLPGDVAASVKQLATDPKRSAKVAAADFTKSAIGMANIPYETQKYLQKKEIPGFRDAKKESPMMLALENMLQLRYPGQELDGKDLPHIPDISGDIDRRLGVEDRGRGDTLASMLGSLAMPGKLAKELAPGRKLAATGAISSAAQGQDPIKGAAEFEALGKTGEAAKIAAPKVAKVAKSTIQAPNKMVNRFKEFAEADSAGKKAMLGKPFFKSNLSAEELGQRLEAAEGTDTPIHEITNSPGLKKIYENAAAAAPFSNVHESMQAIAKQVNDVGEKQLSEAFPSFDSDPNVVVDDLIQKADKSKTQIKKNLYNKLDKTSKSEGFGLNLEGFKGDVKSSLKQIEDSPLMKTQPKTRRMFSRIAGLSKPLGEKESDILDQTGEKFKQESVHTIKDANFLAASLSDEASKLMRSTNRADQAQGELFSRLAKSLRDDVKSEIKERGSDKLNAEHDTAIENYKKDYRGLLDEDIVKYTKGKYNADTIIRDIIKPSKTRDEHTRISKIIDLLPEKDRHALGAAYLKTATDKKGDFSVKMAMDKVNKLGTRQFQALFSPEHQRMLLNLQTLHEMTASARQAFANPQTGQRALTLLMAGLQGGTVATKGMTPLGILGAASPTIAAKIFNKFVTDPEIRDSLVKMLIKEKSKGEK